MPGEDATFIDGEGRRRSRRHSIKTVEECLSDIKLSEKDKKKIITAFETKMEAEITTSNEALQNMYDDLQVKFDNQSTELDHQKGLKGQVEDERNELLLELSREQDVKLGLESELASLEKVKDELLTQLSESKPEKIEPKSTILILKDKMLTKLKDMYFSETVVWKMSEDIETIVDLESSVNDREAIKNLRKYDKLVVLLGLTEVMTTKGGPDMDDLVKRYVTVVRTLAANIPVAVIEIPTIKPDGNYTGPLLFNMNIRKFMIMDNVEYIVTESEANKANNKGKESDKIWQDNITLNEKGLQLFANLITRNVTVPEPNVPDTPMNVDTDDDEVYVGIPNGLTGRLLREGGKHIKRLCSTNKAKVSLGKWSERRGTEREAAIIRGPRSDRKKAKKALLEEAQRHKDYKARN